MADTPKILGQASPLATTLTDVYTVPAVTSALVSSIVVSNQSSTSTTFRISVAIAGAVDATKQYLYYDSSIGGNDTVVATIGLGLATTDVVRVYATLATLSFNVLGIEIT